VEKLRILIVDDEKITTNILSKMLASQHHIETITCHDAQTALEAFRSSHFDIVLSDINMPGMNGLEMIKEIRKYDKKVKIAIFTNFDNKQYMLDAIEYGVNQFFSKPFKRDHFLEVITNLTNEIMTRRKTELELKRQQNILHAIKEMSVHFLQHDDWNRTLHQQMKCLKDAAGASSIFIFKNRHKKSVTEAERFFTINDHDEALAPDLLHYYDQNLTDWKERLSRGRHINGLLNAFNPDQQLLLDAYKIDTLLMLPIFANNRWWGFLGIGNAHGELFDNASIETLETVARIIGSAINNEQNLREYEIRSTMFEHTVDGIIISDANNLIINVNQAFTDITGFTKEEALGKDPKLLKSSIHDKQFYIQMWEQLQQDGYWQGEIKNRRKNDELFIEWLSINVIKNEKGEVQNYVGIFSDVTAHRSNELEYAHLATHDALTGLANRVLLDDRLKQAINQAKRINRSVAVIFCDLDNFKPINDTYGHTAGDLALKKCSEYFTSVVRGEDTVSRYGGDEFVIVLSAIEPEDLDVITKKILNITNVPFEIDGHVITLEMSAGVSFYPQDADSSIELIHKADQAMYRAKKAGKNTLLTFNRPLHR